MSTEIECKIVEMGRGFQLRGSARSKFVAKKFGRKTNKKLVDVRRETQRGYLGGIMKKSYAKSQQSRFLYSNCLLGAVFVASTAFSSQAFAQDATPPAKGAPGGLQEIVVTAQFREQQLQNTPLAISAVTGQMLESRGQTNVVQVAQQVPNVTLKPQASNWGPSLVATIRGVGQYNFNPALEPGVGLFVDDVYYATLTGSMVDLVDVDRIEVLRGPQGTLTGRNSIGGAIRIVSKEPNGENSAYVQASTGSRRLINLRAAADFALADNLFVRISGSSNTQDGYVSRLDYGCANPGSGVAPKASVTAGCKLGPDLGGQNSQSARLMIRYKMSDRADLLITGDIEHEAHPGPAEVLAYHARHPEYICGKWCNYADYTMPDQRSSTSPNAPTWYGYSADPNTKFDAWGVSARLKVELNDNLELTSITAYRKYSSYFASDGDGSPVDPVKSALFMTWINHHFFSQELRLNGQIGPAQYTIGGYYSDQFTLLRGTSDSRPALPLYISNDPVPAKNEAVFGTVILPVTSAFNITGGIRFTHESKDYTFYRYTLTGAVQDPAFNGLHTSESDSVVDYRLSLDYRWSPELLTYFTFSTGFKGGGINPLPTAKVLAIPFRPEKLKNFEAGFKSDLFDHHVRFNTSVFYDKYKDIDETALDCPQFGLTFCSLVTNAGDAELKGVETELQAQFGGLRLDASYSYLDFKFTRVDPSIVGVTIGMVPPYVPKNKWSVGVQYDLDLGSAGVLTPRIDASYQSGMYTNAANGPFNLIAPYTLANASLSWENREKDLNISLHVDNLFDKYYVMNNFDVHAFVGAVRDIVGAPRSFSVTVKKSF